MLRPAEAPVGGLMTLRPHERAKLTAPPARRGRRRPEGVPHLRALYGDEVPASAAGDRELLAILELVAEAVRGPSSRGRGLSAAGLAVGSTSFAPAALSRLDLPWPLPGTEGPAPGEEREVLPLER
jgi:hypothetical protein